MKYRRQDENGDYVFGHNNNDYVKGKLAVAYAIKSKILLFYGEWWEDIGIGIPMFQSIMGQGRSEALKNSAQMLISDRIKEIEEVAAINKVDITFVKRTMEVQISITTTNNEVVEVEVVI
jgi:hypothetical protein